LTGEKEKGIFIPQVMIDIHVNTIAWVWSQRSMMEWVIILRPRNRTAGELKLSQDHHKYIY
jgi:hypothetical protein